MEILYRDEWITLINKPSGLLVHRGEISPDRDSLVDRLAILFPAPPSPVHRLDRPASGVLICANDGETARKLGESFRGGDIHKTYHALVRGWVIESGEIGIPLQRYVRGKVPRGEERGEQEALTRYRPLERGEIPVGNNRYPTSRYTLIEAEPVTGRYHQLRRHLARIGHPILGDTAHGDLRHNGILRDFCGCERLMLHSRQIRFPHPAGGEEILVTAPYPPEFAAVLNRIFPSHS